MDFRSDRRRVHIEDPCIHITHRDESAIDILRVDGRREPELNAIADLDSVLQRIAWNERDNWSEDLFLRNSHLRRYIAEDRRFYKIAILIIAVSQSRAARQQ